MDANPNVRARSIKLLEENTGVNLHDVELGSYFLDVMPEVQ